MEGRTAAEAGQPAGRPRAGTAAGPRAGGADRNGGADRDGPPRDDAAVHAFVERFAGVLTEAGIPRMPARIFAALMATDSSRLTAAEIASTLQVSPAAVSGGVRYLAQVELISRESVPGSRQHVYRMPDNVWHDVMRIRDRVVLRWAQAMREGSEVLGPGTPAGARLAESALYFDFISQELPAMVGRWEAYKAAHQR